MELWAETLNIITDILNILLLIIVSSSILFPFITQLGCVAISNFEYFNLDLYYCIQPVKPLGTWQKVMVVIECNVCHIPDLLNHHGCDWVSVTEVTEIRGGKLHWATHTLRNEGLKPVVLKPLRMWQKSHHTKPHHSVMDVTELGASQLNWATHTH